MMKTQHVMSSAPDADRPSTTKSATNKVPLLKVSKRKDQFADWNVGHNYKLQKMIGVGSYGQVAEAI
jgi:mitogen-activated protein kinase 1/3